MKTPSLALELTTSKAIELLSRITGKKLDAQAVTPPVLFLTALIAVLMGVMFADQTVTDAEKQRWQKTVNRFIPTEGNVRQLTQLLSKGIREQKVYVKIDELLTLVASFSESERLLLISFGYEMACADGSIDEREKQHLQVVADRLGIKSSHLEVLEAAFTQKSISNLSVLEEVRFLLDPARFHELDTLFVSATSDLLEMLPAKPPEPETTQHQTVSYAQLEEFQQSRKALDNLCYQVYQVVQECVDRDFLPNTFVKDIGTISQNLQSQTQKFRLAVFGEFSQGKSTLLNALLGEKIQPVRTIPCSGTVSVLRYGSTKRIICHYKNGRQEEISLDKYKEMAAIPKNVARDGALSEALSKSEIQELIFEHPDLELCRSGVEILDSPGLNEHNERSEITNQLAEKTDAAIFLANATRPLTESELKLIKEFKGRLTIGNSNEPARNIFVVANFIDLLEEEEDRQDVQQRFESLLKVKETLIAGENRIHYISAKAALDALLKGQDNEYLQSFRHFTQAIEQFLVTDRGYLKIEKASKQLQQFIQLSLMELKKAEDKLENKLNLSETERQQILEQIGEATGRDTKIRLFADQLLDEVIEQAIQSFDRWYPPEEDDETETGQDSNVWQVGLRAKIISKSEDWRSEHSHLWSQKQLIADYANQFASAMQQEIDQWGNTELKAKILNPAVTMLEQKIREELAALQHNSTNLSEEINARFSDQLRLIIGGIDDGISGTGGFLGGGAAGVALAAGLYAFTLVAIVPIIIAGVAAAILGSFGMGLMDVDGIHDKIKIEVISKGFDKFDESLETIADRLGEIISSAFESRLEVANDGIQKIIACYENALQLNEKRSRVSQSEVQTSKTWINQKRQELEQIQHEIDTVLNQMIKN
jgi:uncharacterized tellurite resistance protein B-like protein/ribosome biogenesis GTPase A